MSRCRCSDIRKTEENLRKLAKAKDMRPEYQRQKAATNTALGNTQERVETLTESEKVAAYRDKMLTLSDDMNRSDTTIITKINQKISELQDMLEDMREEDEDYHDHEEDDD